MTLRLRTLVAVWCAVGCLACATDEKSGPDRKAGSGGPGSSADSGADATTGRPGAIGFGNSDAARTGIETPDAALLDAGPGPIEFPDDDECGSVVLEPRVDVVIEPGTVLVVFDNSGSMAGTWNGEIKWEAAAYALRDAVSPLSDSLTAGAIVFPIGSASCTVAAIDGGDQIPFLPGGTFLIAWNRFLMTNSPGGGTPLGPALQTADAAFALAPMEGNLDVIVLTDGAPGCDTAPIYALPGQWFARGIRTHVVGLPGSDAAVALLDDMAMNGGTDKHLTPSDARALRDALAEIISETIVSALESCTIPLEPPAPNPDDVHVIVTEDGERHDAERDLGDGGGWEINAAGDEITLFGVFCDKGLAGDYDRIAIEYGCVDLPPLPPPKPPI